MALHSTNPIEKDGRTYGLLAASLALSPMWRSDGVGLSIAVRLIPYRESESGPAYLEDAAKAVVCADAMQEAVNDPDLARFLKAIEAAGQAFVTAKGL